MSANSATNSGSTFTSSADLAGLLHLFKARSADLWNSSERNQVLQETNALLLNGIVSQLVGELRSDTDAATSATAAPSAALNQFGWGFPQQQSMQQQSMQQQQQQQASTLPDLNILRVKAEILFFICYQTQIESGELTQLVALVKGLSNKLVKSDDFQSAPHLDWQAPLFTLLVILQLTLVCALQQTTYLLSRHTDYSQMSVEDVEVGNNLPQRAGDRHHMDDNDWLCAGAKGFCCMAFAVLRQPEVDMDNLPAADVEWFLHEASRLRAYSYIRLCVLPVIQCATLQNKSTGLFYMSVLCELMENMAKIYCMTHYKQSYNNNESDFPYVFFPPTQQFYLDNQAFFRKKLQQSGLPIPRHLLDHPSPVDSLEDVMALFGAICDMRPEFSYIFWPPNEPEDESEEQQEARLSSTAQQPHHQYSVHPFLMKAVDSSFHYSSLLTATIRFVASLSYDPLQKLAYAAYHFVSNARYDAMSWDYCLSQIDSAASKLGSTAPITTTPSQGYFESAQRLSSDALSLHGQHTFGEHDVEELIAILKLISAVSRNKYVARLFVENYKIVSRLFSLIVCNMPVDLKGATLQTLAVFADLGGSVTSEIWELMEVHRLLPFATNSWSTQHQQSVTHQSKIALQTRLAPSPNPNSFMSYQNKLSTPQSTAVWNPFDGQSILNRQANKGLRVELEDAESRIGCYPVTDSFLLLLESLFSQGIPNDLGGEYRLPGVVFYLEYVIDDILCKAKERLYAPQNSPSAYAQRFRLTSRAIKLLSMVLQHYRINEVSVDTLLSSRQRQPNSETTSLDPELLEIVKDFQEIEVEFQIDGVSKQKLRPKSAGFFVMSLLLSRSRLMDLLLELLKECDIAAMNAAFDSLSLFEIGSAFDLTQKIYQHSHHQDQIYSSALGQRVRMPGLIEDVQPMQLTNLGGDRNVSDLVYWQERVVSAVMGLLYECSLRENGFNTLLVASGEKLTITRSEAGRPTSQTVLAYSFADLLASGLNGQAMAVLAHFVQLSARTNPCLPALNVLAIHLLEHVALSMQPEKLISTVMTGSESTFLTSVGLAEKYKRRFMDGCVTAIADSSDFTLIGSGINSLHYDILTIGGNFYPDLYSQASTDNLTASPPLQVTAYSIPTTASLSYRHITSSLDSTFVGVEGRWTPASPQPSRHEQHHHVSERKMSTARELQHGYASAREAMVSMLLSTLLFDHVCLSHYLSGVALQHGRVATWQSSADHSKVNCLTAIIDLLSPNNFINGSTVLQQHPQITMDCFEYVYRLCASPLSSKSTLSILRDKSVNFIMVQLSVLLYLLHVTDDELLEGVTPSLPHSYELRTTLSTVESLKAALNTCVAWLFKICALEIRQAQLAMSSGATDNDDGGHILYAKKLSQLLLTHCSRLSFLGDRGTDRSVLVKVLETVVSVSNAPVISSAGSMMSSLSPSVKEMLNDCLISVDLFKGGRGWKDNKFCMVDNGLGVFKAIDLYRLNSSGQSVHRGSHFPAKQISRDNQLHSSASGRQEKDSLQEISQIVNECNRLLSATNHLCYSWRQLVDVLVSDRNFLCSTAGRGQSMQDLSYSLHEELLKPILHTLLANPSLDMVLAEQFVRSMMAILKCFLSGSDASIFDAGSQGRQQELFNILLSLLVRRKSAADAWVASTAFTPSSITFRGFLTVSVTLLLQVGSGIDSVDSFNDYTSASSEEDKSEARYLVSRDNDNFHYLTVIVMPSPI